MVAFMFSVSQPAAILGSVDLFFLVQSGRRHTFHLMGTTSMPRPKIAKLDVNLALSV